MGEKNQPFNVWPSMAVALEPDLRWIVENQAEIIVACKARPMPKTRPVKVWPDGRVRIEFVGTFHSSGRAFAFCMMKMGRPKPGEAADTSIVR